MGKPSLMTVAFEDAVTAEGMGALLREDDDGLVQATDNDLVEVRDDSKEIDELITAARVVEDVGQTLQSAAQQNGMARSEAEAIDVALEGLYRCVGLGDPRRMSLEEFGDSRPSRIEACQIAMEDMAENIRRIIRKIVAWIKHVAQVCYDLVERIVQGANAVVDRGDRLHKAAGVLSMTRIDPSKLGQISKGQLLNFFNEAGRPMPAREIAQKYEQFCHQVNRAFDGVRLILPASQALTLVQTYIQKHGEKAMDVEAVETIAAHACAQLERESLAGFSPQKKEDGKLLSSKLPFGNSELVFSLHTGIKLTETPVGFSASIKTHPIEGAAALKYLTPQEVMNLMSVLTTQMGQGIYRDSKAIKAAIHELTKRVEKESQLLTDRQRQAGASVVPTLHLIRTICDSSMSLTRQLYSYSGITTRRILAYGEASLVAHHNARTA